jgi:hypothetical protein
MEDQRDNLGRFVPGVSGNPKGRPKGARTHLSQKFFDDLAQAWDRSGESILRDMAQNDPAALAKMIAALQPKMQDIELNADVVVDHPNSIRIVAELDDD